MKNIKYALKEMHARKEVIVSFNLFNNASISGVLRAAKEVNRPVILGVTEPDLKRYGIEELAATVKIKADRAGVDAALHLDHSMNLELVMRCIYVGFSSIMIDPSDLEMEQRTEVVKEVVEAGMTSNIMVESMVGHPKTTALGAQNGENVTEELTDPEEAAVFANETGVDLLAVSVGTGHDRALTCGQVKLDLPLLKAIAEKVPQPLVIHGGSSIDEAQLREIRNYNVGKVNIGTVIRLAYKNAIVKALAENPHIDMVAADAIGEDAIYRVALEKMRILSC